MAPLASGVNGGALLIGDGDGDGHVWEHHHVVEGENG